MTSEKLLPCPFAGCKAPVELKRAALDEDFPHRVVHRCDVVKSTMVCTVERWNTRHESEAVKGLAETLRRIRYGFPQDANDLNDLLVDKDFCRGILAERLSDMEMANEALVKYKKERANG